MSSFVRQFHYCQEQNGKNIHVYGICITINESCIPYSLISNVNKAMLMTNQYLHSLLSFWDTLSVSLNFPTPNIIVP